MDLQEIRKHLDKIDSEMEHLFEERMKLCGEVAEFKIATGKAVYDAEREKQKIQTVTDMAEGDFNKQAVGELFLQMMTLSRRYQYRLMAGRLSRSNLGFQRVEELPVADKKIVYQGLPGAYSHAAAMKYFGHDANLSHVRRFEDLMIAIRDGDADYGVLPIENSSAGAVTDNYDLLLKYDNYIAAEIFVPINHMLLGTQDADISEIRRVYAHPQALLQSAEFLNAKPEWQQISLENNAVAARKVRDENDRTQAAIAGDEAGQIYGLKALAGPINHSRTNTTRFLILSKVPLYRAAAEKISLCFELPHQSGSLYNMLGNFIFNHVNMRMIESRPIPDRNWEYRFFVDIEGNLEDPAVINAIHGIEKEANHMKILGNY
ncbi:MAG: bifunctional chorismate mutase/prephenate dehydratase [Clostridium sp.]